MHSLIGPSSAKRWMACSGYLHLAENTPEAYDPDRLDPDWTREGIAAHAVAAQCLNSGADAWEFSGEVVNGVTVGEGENQVSTVAIQAYLDECRRFLLPDTKQSYWIETRIQSSQDKTAMGTVDFACLSGGKLIIRDLKFGEGVYVEVVENEQLMYYAWLLLTEVIMHGKAHMVEQDWPVEIGIVQPRHWEYKGPCVWATSCKRILDWGSNVLIPRMKEQRKAATEDPQYVLGEHCRFCPVKLRCPAMRAMFGAAVKAQRTGISPKAFLDAELGLEYSMVPMAEMYLKAVKDEVNYRATNGRIDPNWKLVPKKTNRAWKDGALPAMRDAFGDLAMTTPTLKSPAQMEEISDAAKQLVAQWTFTPKGQLQAAQVNSRTPGEKAVTLADVFSGYENKQA